MEKTAEEVADAVQRELGNWTLSQMNEQGLHGAVWDLYPGFQHLSKAEQDVFFREVLELIW